MAKPTKQIALYSSLSVTGQVTTPEVTVPVDFTEGYINVILSSPISEANIFDISVVIEVLDNDVWKAQDVIKQIRDITNGPLEAVNIGASARLENLAGKKVRAKLACGQSNLNASIIINY